MFEEALNILKEIENKGFKAYIIGGYVRDFILGLQTSDIDITTSATPDVIKEMYEVVMDNSKFGSLRIKKNNYTFEITTFRCDKYDDTRYPIVEFTDSLPLDLKRRDFTMNTICMDYNKQIIDLMNGVDDINHKVIKSIGNADIKLKEDPLRILRAIRFMGYLDFTLDDSLEKAINDNKELLLSLSNKRVNSEISKMNKKSLLIVKQMGLNRYIKEEL